MTYSFTYIECGNIMDGPARGVIHTTMSLLLLNTTIRILDVGIGVTN